MPPSPIPAPLPPWARFLLQVAPFITAGLQEALEFIGELKDSATTTPSEWRHVQVVFEPTTGLETADRAVTTFDVVNVTNGAVDNSWTQADYDGVENVLAGLVNSWLSHMQSGYKRIESRYYRAMFNPLSDPKPFVKSGAPEITYAYNNPGLGTGIQARQVAWTTTERTTYPRHWGRNYWPFAAAGTAMSSNGLIASSIVTSWAQAVHDAYNTLMAAEFFPVVPVTQVDKVPTRGLLGVTEIQMDDIPDVIRRRRPKHGVTTVRLPTP